MAVRSRPSFLRLCTRRPACRKSSAVCAVLALSLCHACLAAACMHSPVEGGRKGGREGGREGGRWQIEAARRCCVVCPTYLVVVFAARAIRSLMRTGRKHSQGTHRSMGVLVGLLDRLLRGRWLAPTSVCSGAGPTALIPSRRIAYSAHAGGGGTWFAVGSLRLAQVRQCRVRQQGEGQSALGGDGAVAQGARARHPIAGRPLEVVGPSARRMPPPARPPAGCHSTCSVADCTGASVLIFQH
jgi:hypothetical protein